MESEMRIYRFTCLVCEVEIPPIVRDSVGNSCISPEFTNHHYVWHARHQKTNSPSSERDRLWDFKWEFK